MKERMEWRRGGSGGESGGEEGVEERRERVRVEGDRECERGESEGRRYEVRGSELKIKHIP